MELVGFGGGPSKECITARCTTLLPANVIPSYITIESNETDLHIRIQAATRAAMSNTLNNPPGPSVAMCIHTGRASMKRKFNEPAIEIAWALCINKPKNV